MYFDSECVDGLLSKVDILSLIKSYTSVTRSGANYVALCPFHREKTPSMFVYTKTNSFYCFGCGVGGNAITFLMKVDNISYSDAVVSLSERVGVSVHFCEKDDSFSKKRIIYSINKKCARIYFSNLLSKNGHVAFEYLTKRGLSLDTIKKFGLGFSFEDGISLFNSLKSSFSKSDLISSNVVVQYKNSLRDRFIGRVMFPVIDSRGNVIAFGARAIGDNTPKYLNTSDTLAFKKSKNLFALNMVKNCECAILAEGYMDAISLHQLGFECAISSLGTSLTNYQAKLISRQFDKVYICYDSDNAGQIATNKALEMLNNSGANVRVISLSESKVKDPDEFSRLYGSMAKEKFAELIESSLGYIDYKINRMKTSLNLKNTSDKIIFLKECSKIISKIKDPVERDVYSSRICLEYDISKDAFDLQVIKCINKDSDFAGVSIHKFRNDLRSSSGTEEFLISSLVAFGRFPNFLFNLSSENFHSNICFKIFSEIVWLASNGVLVNFDNVSNRLDGNVLNNFIKMANLRGSEDVSEDDIKKAYKILLEEGKFKEFKSENAFENDDVLSFLDKLKESRK